MTLWRFSFFFTGIFILALGIALTIHSNLGTSPFDALQVGLYINFGLTVGSWEIFLGTCFVILNALLQWKKPEYLCIVTSLFTGVCIDFWLFMTPWVQPEHIITQFIVLLFGLIFMGLGIAVNLQADFAPNPMDRTMLVIKKLTGLNVTVSRGIISIVLVILAFILSGPIGIGTVLSALFGGMIIQSFMPYVQSVYEMKKTHRKTHLSS
ncbi:YczE/YyaS/YitT family protein [Texcoconibacillus texcoconensis]|uniref:YitT family protein n=1 Tax=Texcoconibacillus texcoconensis TaxID=1095777 RepID=A0A840QSH6_9BACI|nr:YitT family protein [Texcoconibacillus texcoconensis]MBB5174300.1 hypothetical protein [Texcoconibacillus texcoconensis]